MQQHDKWRGTSTSRGYDGQWQVVRVQAMKRDQYLCQQCKRDGRVTLAADVDHIVPITVAYDRRLDLSNLQCLCRQHHQQKTAADKALYG
jgi:5-methylcytosine-specific restriction protein A